MGEKEKGCHDFCKYATGFLPMVFKVYCSKMGEEPIKTRHDCDMYEEWEDAT